MESKKRQAEKWLCIAIALMLISMIGASLVQTSGGKVTVKDICWDTSLGIKMSGILFVPDGASADNPAPAVVLCHGMYNNKEMQDAYYTELSRRGFVVLAIDMFSHGDSENLKAPDYLPMSVNEGLKLISTLSYVDASRIGIEGHSMGGMCCEVATQMDNMNEKPLVSALLLNGCFATYTDPKSGEYVNIYGKRSVGIIASQYDEFLFRETKDDGSVALPSEFINYANAQSFLRFGTAPQGLEALDANTMYNDNIDGKDAFRIVYTPATTHPASLVSKAVTADVIEFFDKALGAPVSIAATNQIWQLKQTFNLLGLIGLFIFMVNFAILMVFTPFFATLNASELVESRPMIKGGKPWFWGGLSAAAVFGALAYLPIVIGLKSDANGKVLFAQNTTFGISAWAAICGIFILLCLVLTYKLNGKKNGFSLTESGVTLNISRLMKTVLLAVIVVAVTYSWVFFAQYFFDTDFHIWILAARPFTSEKAIMSLFPYSLLFTIFFIASSISINSFGYYDIGKRKSGHGWLNTVIVASFTAFPAVVLVAIQYIHLFSYGDVLWSANNAHSMIVWLFPLAVFLPVSAVVSRKIYRVTNNPYLPGIINALLAALICCANTSTWG